MTKLRGITDPLYINYIAFVFPLFFVEGNALMRPVTGLLFLSIRRRNFLMAYLDVVNPVLSDTMKVVHKPYVNIPTNRRFSGAFYETGIGGGSL